MGTPTLEVLRLRVVAQEADIGRGILADLDEAGIGQYVRAAVAAENAKPKAPAAARPKPKPEAKPKPKPGPKAKTDMKPKPQRQRRSVGVGKYPKRGTEAKCLSCEEIKPMKAMGMCGGCYHRSLSTGDHTEATAVPPAIGADIKALKDRIRMNPKRTAFFVALLANKNPPQIALAGLYTFESVGIIKLTSADQPVITDLGRRWAASCGITA